MKMIPASASRLFLLLSIPGFLPGCFTDGMEKGTAASEPTVPVVLGTVLRKDVPVEIPAIGIVEAYSTVDIKAQVGGELARVSFQEGDEVRKGDLLFTIDSHPYEVALKQAEAAQERDTAQWKNAEREVTRNKDLVAKEYSSKDDYDKIVTNAEALKAVLKADEAAVENARIQIGYCSIRSAIDGRMGRLLVHPGNIVKANADTPLAVIHQVRPVRVLFSVPEKHLGEIRRRQAESRLRVKAIVPGGSSHPVLGELTFIDNSVDQTTGSIPLKATFENQDEALWPGQFVDVSLLLATLQGALVVPSQAIQIAQKGSFVFAVKDDATVEMRPVKVVLTAGQESAVEGDLKPGETIVTEGQLRLIPGKSKVEQKKGPEAGAGKANP